MIFCCVYNILLDPRFFSFFRFVFYFSLDLLFCCLTSVPVFKFILVLFVKCTTKPRLNLRFFLSLIEKCSTFLQIYSCASRKVYHKTPPKLAVFPVSP